MSQIGGLGTFIHEVGVCPSTCAISRYLWNVCLIDSWRIILILVVYMICYLWVAYTWALVNYLLGADECVIIGRKALVIMACGCSNDDDTEWLWKWAQHSIHSWRFSDLWLQTVSSCHCVTGFLLDQVPLFYSLFCLLMFSSGCFLLLLLLLPQAFLSLCL